MGDLIRLDGDSPKVYERDGQAWTDSLEVSRVFGKRHDNVRRDIENLECSQEFRLLNFEESSYLNEQNKLQPMYEMTEEGFTFLAMRFTGKEAAVFQEAYIKRFKEMREYISRQLIRTSQHDLILLAMTQNITLLTEMAKDNKEDVSGLIKRYNDDVPELITRVTGIECHLKINERKKVPKAVRKIHIDLVSRKYAGKCPCCQLNIVVENEYKTSNGEYDHFQDPPSFSTAKETWLICKECHNKFNYGKEAKALHIPSFIHYQKLLAEADTSKKQLMFEGI